MGGSSTVGTCTTWPHTGPGSGALLAVAGCRGVDRERRVHVEVGGVDGLEAFGSERKPSFTSHVQVSQGIVAVAVLPLIVSGTGELPVPSQ